MGTDTELYSLRAPLDSKVREFPALGTKLSDPCFWSDYAPLEGDQLEVRIVPVSGGASEVFTTLLDDGDARIDNVTSGQVLVYEFRVREESVGFWSEWQRATIIVDSEGAPPAFIPPIPGQTDAQGDVVSFDTTTFFTNADSYSLIGTLPSGLSFSAGVISGTVDTVETLAGIIVRATNAFGFTDSNPFGWVVTSSAPTLVGPIPTQTDTEGEAVSVDLSVYFAGATSYADNGMLPPGLSLNTSTAEVTGTPVIPAQPLGVSYGGIVVTATNTWGSVDSNAFTWEIEEGTPAAPSNFTVIAIRTNAADVTFEDNSDNEDEFQLQTAPAVGGPWSDNGAPLAADSTSGTLTSLLASTTYYARVLSKNASGQGISDVAMFNTPGTDSPPSFTGEVPDLFLSKDIPVSVNIAQYFSDVDSAPNGVFSLQAGVLPAGMSLTGATGVIEGTPTTEETQAGIVIRATNDEGFDDTNAFDMTVITAVAVSTAWGRSGPDTWIALRDDGAEIRIERGKDAGGVTEYTGYVNDVELTDDAPSLAAAVKSWEFMQHYLRGWRKA